MIQDELKALLLAEGVSDLGFAEIGTAAPAGLPYALSIVVRLSDAVVEEITDTPTATYFHHYRTVNAYIDRVLLKAGLFLQNQGYRYLAVGASQSQPGTPFDGRFSHKEAACRAGLGSIGRSNLFLHTAYGARVRLGTLFTNCLLTREREIPQNPCLGCNACMRACPGGAILGKDFYEGIPREELFSPAVCSSFMKEKYQSIGRGAVCGICMRVCPVGQPEKNPAE